MFKMRLSFCGPVAHDAEGHDGEEVEKQTEYRPEGFVHALVHGALIEPCGDGQPVVKRQHGPQHAEAADDGIVHRIERGYLAFPRVLTVMLTIPVVPVAALAAVRIIRIIRAVRGGLLRKSVLLLERGGVAYLARETERNGDSRDDGEDDEQQRDALEGLCVVEIHYMVFHGNVLHHFILW